MSLKTTYTTLHQQTSQNELPFVQQIENLSRTNLKEKDTWFQGLAILDHAVDRLPEAGPEVLDFHRKLIAEGLDFKASVYLNEEDYAFYWETLLSVLKRLALHFPEVYGQISFQYLEARSSYKEKEKIVFYLDKGIEHNAEIAIAVKGYFQYYGIQMEQDETQGMALLNSTDSEWNSLYKGYIALNKGEKEELPALISKLKLSTDSLIKKNILAFEGSYLESTDDFEGAKAVYQQVIEEYDTGFARLRLGVIKIRESDEQSNRDEVFALWKEAFELGSIEAANHLGYHSIPEYNNGSSANAAHWFELGYLYNNAFAAYRLALIYLYVPEFLNVEKGLFYLDEALRLESVDAIIEKAEILMDGALVEKDENQALKLFLQAADKKLPYALNRIGFFYESGIIITDTPDVAKALTFYEEAAAMNFAMGLNNAGRIYRYGLLGEADRAKAKAYFEKGTALNTPYAMTELALMYEEDVEQDYQKSFELFNQAAALDYPFAINAAAIYLENGYHNETPDPEAAFQYYKKGAELNDISSTFDLGRCYRFGLGTQENPDLALEYYQKAADAGNPKAQVELALCYEHEYGVEFDPQKAFQYMEQAAEQGYYYGEYKLGYYYLHGLLERDAEKGLYWLEKAGESGSAHALLELGDYYLYDYDNLDQAENAVTYYHSALEKGIINEGLGLCYEYGLGVESNMSEAFKYFEMAANNGYVVAMYHTGRCYLNGFGVKANPEEAYRWFNDAAQNDNVAAQFNAGTLLLSGKGVAMDKEQGIELLNKAAAEEYAEAQFSLGNCYLMGDGVEENEDTAMYWFEKAADNGHEKAAKLVGRKAGR